MSLPAQRRDAQPPIEVQGPVAEPVMGLAVLDEVRLPLAHPRVWITRDSDLMTGALADFCDLWVARPRRVPPARKDGEVGACWINPDDVPYEQCYLGPHSIGAVRDWLGTLPDSDLMCVVVEEPRTLN